MGDREPDRRLLKPREAAHHLAVSDRTLWALTNRGDLPSVRIGRSVRYDIQDLDAWIARRKSVGSPTGGDAEML